MTVKLFKICNLQRIQYHIRKNVLKVFLPLSLWLFLSTLLFVCCSQINFDSHDRHYDPIKVNFTRKFIFKFLTLDIKLFLMSV